LYGYETWSLILRERHGLRVSENRLLRRIFGPKKKKWREVGEDYIMRSFITYTLQQCCYGDEVKKGRMGGAYSTHRRDEK
jgi:hypothetical protein